MRFCPAFHVVQLMRQASRFVLSNLEIEESSYPKPIWPGTGLLDRKHPDWLACYPQQGEFLVLRLVGLCKSTITTSELYGIKRDPWLYCELLFTNASLEYLTLGPLGCEPALLGCLFQYTKGLNWTTPQKTRILPMSNAFS